VVVELDGTRLSHSDIVELWILGEKLGMRRLQNQTINVLDQIRSGNEFITQTTFQRIYDRTSVGSPLRRYIVNLVSRGKSPILNAAAFPHQMLVDVVNQMKKVAPKQSLLYTDDEMRGFYVSLDAPQTRGISGSSLHLPNKPGEVGILETRERS